MPISTFLNGRPPTRGLTWLALSDQLTIETPIVVSDSGGGGTVTWHAAGTVACRIAPLSRRPTEKLTAGQIDERSTHTVTAPPGTGVSSSDRVLISNHGTFEVTGVHQRTGALTTVFEVIQIL